MCVHACMADGVKGGLYTLRRPVRWSHIFHLAIIERSEIKNLYKLYSTKKWEYVITF